MSEFRECVTCAAKPGAPYLCEACLHNRGLIAQLRDELYEKTCAYQWLARQHHWNAWSLPGTRTAPQRMELCVHRHGGAKWSIDTVDTAEGIGRAVDALLRRHGLRATRRGEEEPIQPMSPARAVYEFALAQQPLQGLREQQIAAQLAKAFCEQNGIEWPEGESP